MFLFKNRPEFYAHMQKGVVAEIGVLYGDNAQTILDSDVQKLILIDCWEQQSGEYAKDPSNAQLVGAYEGVVHRFAYEPRVNILKAYSLEAASQFADEYFDWVYLDGNHTLEAVKADLAAWWPKIKIGGFLCGHDYIAESYNKSYTYIQVKQAVDEFCSNLYALTDEKYGSWAIRRTK